MDNRADRDLVAEARSGGVGGAEGLVRRYYRRSLALAWHLLDDGSDAPDVTQDAFVSALQGLRELRDPDRFWPWLARIVVNRCRSIRRRREAQPPTESLDQAELPAATPDLEDCECREAVTAAVGRLPETQREAVVLFYYHGLSQEEVAAALDCSPNAVKARLFAARRRLARDLIGWQ